MRVAQLSKLNSGGATLYARALNEGLREKGIDSWLIHQEEVAQCPDVRWKQQNRFLNRVFGRFYVDTQRAVFHPTNRFREQDLCELLSDCDLVHIHQATDWMGLSNLFANIPSTTPVIISLHDLWTITGGCVIFNGCEKYRESCENCPILKPPFSSFLAKRQLQLKRRVYDRDNITFVANSGWTRAQMMGASVLRDDHEIRVIHPAVDTTCFTPGDRDAARSALGVDQDTFVVCSGSASITDTNKNIPAVLRAVQSLRSGRPVVTMIFGDGHLNVPDGLDVRFLGPIENQLSLAKAYQASDVFVSTSRMETYGMTLIEAMACAVPPVAYRTGAIPSVIEDGQTGILVGVDDEQAIVNSIEALIADDDLRRYLGKAASEVVTRRNSLDALVGQHESLYGAVLSRQSKFNHGI